MPEVTAVDLPPLIDLSQVASPRDGIVVNLVATFDVTTKSYTPSQVQVAAVFGRIGSRDIHRLALRRTMADALRPRLLDANPEAVSTFPILKTWANGRTSHVRSTHVAEHPTKAQLQSAAIVARFERYVGGAPCRAIERCCGIDYASARRWYRHIKQSHLLG